MDRGQFMGTLAVVAVETKRTPLSVAGESGDKTIKDAVVFGIRAQMTF